MLVSFDFEGLEETGGEILEKLEREPTIDLVDWLERSPSEEVLVSPLGVALIPIEDVDLNVELCNDEPGFRLEELVWDRGTLEDGLSVSLTEDPLELEASVLSSVALFGRIVLEPAICFEDSELALVLETDVTDRDEPPLDPDCIDNRVFDLLLEIPLEEPETLDAAEPDFPDMDPEGVTEI